ncbi:MAG TPA: hypothetical protein VF788_06190 [Pseudonocardiaceae bacterium]
MGGEVLIIGGDPRGVLAGATRAAADLLLLSAAVTSLVAMGFLLARAAQNEGSGMQLLRVGLGSPLWCCHGSLSTPFSPCAMPASTTTPTDGGGGLQPAGVVRGGQASQRRSRRGTR